jgi:hypothetical protein
MQYSPSYSEEVGITLLLLSISLFKDFWISDSFLLLQPRNKTQIKYVRSFLTFLRLATGHYFYIQTNIEQDSWIRLYCLDTPTYFQKLLLKCKQH